MQDPCDNDDSLSLQSDDEAEENITMVAAEGTTAADDQTNTSNADPAASEQTDDPIYHYQPKWLKKLLKKWIAIGALVGQSK
jgi:hypothetical protein